MVVLERRGRVGERKNESRKGTERGRVGRGKRLQREVERVE